jgi:V/A-type H+-transporting ATPase subunit A
MADNYYVYGINGPVVKVRGGKGLCVMDMVHVGDMALIGEVVEVDSGETTVQVYEETSGLKPGAPVTSTGAPMSIDLGPGLLGNIFDGIARPLRAIEASSGDFIARGINLPSLNPETEWEVEVKAAVGDKVCSGVIYAEVQETPIIRHRCIVPPGVSGTIVSAKPGGKYTVKDTIVEIETDGGILPLTLSQKWTIRTARPSKERLPIDRPLITGQRVIDTLFPIAKGGCAAIPGPFGAGKTVTQHQLAKWSDADIIVYLGCGERGNEMTQVLEEFSELIDPKSGMPILSRTVLIANTSNMPVAAREASIYTGMTIAEYFRDMGYHVAIMADSTSRWAEALREISGRLEEMPAEEGFPAYLPSRLAEFYERAGYVETLGGAEGSVTVIGAVSPQGGDFSEPVTQNTKRFVRCFWALDRALAYSRHFPSINWITSYSEYKDDLEPWYAERFGDKFVKLRNRISALMQDESKLMEIVKLIGEDILPEDQKLVIETARIVRSGFLQQNSFHEVDTYVPLEKQLRMMEIICHFYDKAKTLVDNSIPLSQLKASGISEEIIRIKYEVENDRLDKLDKYFALIDSAVDKAIQSNIA